ncbi:MAG: hypothetical protein MI892_03850 [Desulfobacterales bacterium]|nr:hypothetical protein [Desulfobacterales bacterium]
MATSDYKYAKSIAPVLAYGCSKIGNDNGCFAVVETTPRSKDSFSGEKNYRDGNEYKRYSFSFKMKHDYSSNYFPFSKNCNYFG